MTARMLLPFSMGTYRPANSFTVYQEIDHPILSIGSSYSAIKEPILVWLHEQYGNQIHYGFDGKEYFIDFPSEADKTMFMLRWL